jgi:transcription-repair coupling factor (superfamily II helicase)
LRGDILDVYPFASDLPLRIELLDDEIESLRTFDPTDQRSIESFPHVDVCLAADHAEGDDAEGTLLIQLLAPDVSWVEVEPLRIEESAESLRIQLPAHERALRTYHAVRAERRRLLLQSLPADDVGFDARSVQSLEVGLRRAPEELRALASHGTRIVVLCETEAEAVRFSGLLQESGGVEGLATTVGTISRGFHLPGLALVAVNERELKGIAGLRRTSHAATRHRSRAIQSFFELKPRDHVVHAVHGLALFVGLERMQRGTGEEEHLHLRFADDVSLYVPASRIDLVQRYIGSGSTAVALDKIGSTSFRRRKEKVQRAGRSISPRS